MIKICQIQIYAKYNQININKNIFKKIDTAFFDRKKKKKKNSTDCGLHCRGLNKERVYL